VSQAPPTPILPRSNGLAPLGRAAQLLMVVALAMLVAPLGSAFFGVGALVEDAILVAVGATAIGWSVAHGRRLALIGGALLFTGFAGYLLHFVTLVLEYEEVWSAWQTLELCAAGGLLLIAWAVAPNARGERAPATLVGIGVAAAGLVLRLLAAAGVSPDMSTHLGMLLLALGLVAVVMSRRRDLAGEETPADAPGAGNQDVLDRARDGVRLYRLGVTTYLVASVVGGVFVAFFSQAPAGFQAGADLLRQLGVLAAWVLVVRATSRLRHLPVASGAATHVYASYVVHAVVATAFVATLGFTIFGLTDWWVASRLRIAALSQLHLPPTIAGQLLLFAGLARLGVWLRSADLAHAGRRAMLWFGLGAVLVIGGWLIPAEYHGLTIALLLVALIFLITGLVKLYEALQAFDEALSKRVWVSAFDDSDDEDEPDTGALVAEEEPA